MNKKTLRIFIYTFLIFFAILGCGRTPREKDKIIATINNEPLYVKDLKLSLALTLKSDPIFRITPQTLENQVNMLIDRRLLIQEAKKLNLDQTERFINTIKIFWEQTLIRDLMLSKEKEFNGKRELFNTWFDEVRKKADVKIKRDVLGGFQYKYNHE